jgi:hypothetical protein
MEAGYGGRLWRPAMEAGSHSGIARLVQQPLGSSALSPSCVFVTTKKKDHGCCPIPHISCLRTQTHNTKLPGTCTYTSSTCMQ